MPATLSKEPAPDEEAVQLYDAIIIGAGISGMYQLLRLRELGMSVRVFETGDGVGGTWYWNRYPGARFDSESYSYGYSFSDELLQEWEWSEHFAAQPETLRYVNYVADKFDLRKDIQFSSRIKSAFFDDADNRWELETEDGLRARARFLITAIGLFSAPTVPNIEGIGCFDGPAFHTGNWPQEPVDFSGKRVAVIGTGATGVQVIQEVAKTVGHLTVFQLRPEWCAPLHNRPIDPETQKIIKASYPEIFAKCRESATAFIHKADKRRALEVGREEREAFYERLYSTPGFAIWLANFRDIFFDESANDTISDFVARKIRERVKDPKISEKLIPKDHGFGTRRVPMETNYYEVYNQKNVKLVDLLETPIKRITPKGIRTSAAEHDFDIIIYATGFDAVTGGFDRIDIRGVGGQRLKDKWAGGPQTFLGLQVEGFPNMLTLVGPHNGASFCNIPRCIEQNVDWVTDLIRHMQAHQYMRFEATREAEVEWTRHVHESAERMLYSKIDSWFMGINPNVPGKQKRVFLLYGAGMPTYREKCDEVAADGYVKMVFA